MTGNTTGVIHSKSQTFREEAGYLNYDISYFHYSKIHFVFKGDSNICWMYVNVICTSTVMTYSKIVMEKN